MYVMPSYLIRGVGRICKMDEGGEGGYAEAWKVINEVIPKKENKGRKKRKVKSLELVHKREWTCGLLTFKIYMEESELIPAVISDLDINEAYDSVPMLCVFLLIPKY